MPPTPSRSASFRPDIYLRSLPRERPTGVLDTLVWFFMLDVYGPSGLSERARIGLRRGALLLAIVLGFDLLAWTVFFNLVFHQGNFALSGLSLLAVVLASMLSAVTVLFEANLFTTDLTPIGKLYRRSHADGQPRAPGEAIGLLAGIGGRLIIIFGAAFLTAMPLHVLLFDGPIRERALEEQAQERALLLVRAYLDEQDTMTRIVGGPAEDPSVNAGVPVERAMIDNKRDATDEKVKQAKAELAKAQQAVEDATKKVARLNQEIRRARDNSRMFAQRAKRGRDPITDEAVSPDQIATWRSASGYHATRANNKREELAVAEVEVEEKRTLRDRAQASLQAATSEADDVKRSTTEEIKRIVGTKQGTMKEIIDFINAIRTSSPNGYQEIVSSGGNYTYRFNAPPFFERLRMLDDLTEGLPPRWPTGTPSPEEIDLLDAQLHMDHPDALDYEVELRESERLWTMWWATLAVGMIIPVIAFLFKLMIPKDLKDYYRPSFQFRQLNPGTRLRPGKAVIPGSGSPDTERS